MVLVEAVENRGEFGDWEKELGIEVPVAPVLIQLDNFTHPDVVKQRGFTFPESRYFTWITTPVDLSGGLEDEYEGFGVIDPDGRCGNLGIAIPKQDFIPLMSEQQMFEEPQPFWFFHGGAEWAEVLPVERVAIREGRRRLLGQLEEFSEGSFAVEMKSRQVLQGAVRAWMIGHEFVNSAVTREVYTVAQMGEVKMNELLLGGERAVSEESAFGIQERVIKVKPAVNRGFLMSGREARGKKVGWRPGVPFEMLLGRAEPWLVGRFFDKQNKRSQGWESDKEFVY